MNGAPLRITGSVVPGVDQLPAPDRIGGWLLLLCVLLIVWRPINLAMAAANALGAVYVRGAPLILVLVARLLVTAFGMAAGVALASRRPAAVAMTQTALALSAAMDLFVYATPFFPNNRMPGDTPFYVAASLAYHSLWMLYLFKSRRVKVTFGP